MNAGASAREAGRVVSEAWGGFTAPPRWKANTAHITLSRPDSGRDFQIKVLKTFQGVPTSLGSVLHLNPYTMNAGASAREAGRAVGESPGGVDSRAAKKVL